MSALGGILYFGEATPDEQAIARLGELLLTFGPDGGRDLLSGQVGFCYRAFHTNRESRSVEQPFVTRDRLILTWDGRLDNREELARSIGMGLHDGSRPIADVELVEASYRLWGADFPSKLVGDFALALWDQRAMKLFLARDPVGVRPLYYRADARRIIWSSDLTALLEISSAELKIDEQHVAGYLSFGIDTSSTPFHNFKAVRPGHVIAVDLAGAVVDRMFWGLNPDARIRFANDSDYEERFLELFKESVASRLRAEGTVFAELSGGLDSSSIVCMADQLLKDGSVAAMGLEMVSHVSDECKESDERRFIRYVEDHVGRSSNYIRIEDYPYLTPMPDVSRVSTINPYLINCGYQIGLGKLMQDHGARVLLTGLGGDELLHSVNDPAPELSELFVTFKFLTLARRLKVWGKLLREPYGRLLWRKAILPVLPLPIRAALKAEGRVYVPAWLNPDFVARTGLRERNVQTPDIYGFRRPTGRDQAIGFLSVVNRISMGYYAETAGHDISCPYFHRPLVEFLCAIPFEQLLRPGESRSLMRRSLAGLLPDQILRRKGKGNPSQIVAHGFERQWPQWRDLFVDPLVSAYGFVDMRHLEEALKRARHGSVSEAFQLSPILTLEVWLRAVEERKKRWRSYAVSYSSDEDVVLVG